MRSTINAPVAEQPAHWASAVAQTTLDRDEAERRARDEKAQEIARFRDLVETDGARFFEHVAAAMQEATRAFNAHVGVEAVVFQATANGALSLRSVREGAYVLITSDLRTHISNQPGAMVTIRQYGRGGARPYDLVREGDELRMFVSGQALSAEAFARHAVESWLRALQPAPVRA